jgi:2-iminobutanoate/2-iminopropanoate deaminase
VRRVATVALAVGALSGCAVISAVGGGGGSPAPPAGPYEAVRRGGGLLFLAGQLGTRDDGSLVGGGIQPETRRALEKIQALVESEGSTMDRVVKCTVFLADIAEWDAMNVEYAKFFPGRKPARTAVGGIEIPRAGRVEIECIASVG